MMRESMKSLKEKVINRLGLYAVLGINLSIFLPLLAYLFSDIWWLDNLSHFRPFYMFSAFLCSVVLLSNKKWRPLGFVGLPAGLFFMYSVYGTTFQKSSEKTPNLQVISFNILTINKNKEEVIDYIRSKIKKDRNNIVFLLETNMEWVEKLKSLEDRLPNSVYHTREDNFGFSFLSDLPIASHEKIPLDILGLPVLKVLFNIGSREFLFWGVHTIPPMGEGHFKAREEHLTNLATLINREENPFLIAGDFNLSPFSPHFSQFLNKFEKKVYRAGKNYSYTSSWNRLFLGILIDHILYSESFKPIKYEVGPSLGSDHKAIVTEFYY